MKCLAYFVDKLKNTPDGDGTLLDHSLILYGTNMGDSNQHLHYDVPHMLIGGASGQLKGDRHLAYQSQDRSHRQSAAEHSRHVRHSPGQDRRQHGPSCRVWSNRLDMPTRRVLTVCPAACGGVLLFGLRAFGASNSPVADAAMKGDKAARRVPAAAEGGRKRPASGWRDGDPVGRLSRRPGDGRCADCRGRRTSSWPIARARRRCIWRRCMAARR